MTREIRVGLPPREVLERAKRFFTGPESAYAGSLEEEGEGFARFRAFRGTVAVTAQREGDGEGRTRVRVSTLRAHPSIPLFLTWLRESSPEGAPRA
ncbi:MAG: hypothetical protein ACREKI_04795 [Gemmatimonadota bacterium]